MPDKRSFAVQTLLATVLLNGALLVAITLLLGDALAASGQMVLLWVLGAVFTLVLWGVIYWIGSRMVDRIPEPVTTAPLPAKERVRPAPPAALATPATTPAMRQEPGTTAEGGALQLLAIMQREGRLNRLSARGPARLRRRPDRRGGAPDPRRLPPGARRAHQARADLFGNRGQHGQRGAGLRCTCHPPDRNCRRRAALPWRAATPWLASNRHRAAEAGLQPRPAADPCLAEVEVQG